MPSFVLLFKHVVIKFAKHKRAKLFPLASFTQLHRKHAAPDRIRRSVSYASLQILPTQTCSVAPAGSQDPTLTDLNTSTQKMYVLRSPDFK